MQYLLYWGYTLLIDAALILSGLVFILRFCQAFLRFVLALVVFVPVVYFADIAAQFGYWAIRTSIEGEMGPDGGPKIVFHALYWTPNFVCLATLVWIVGYAFTKLRPVDRRCRFESLESSELAANPYSEPKTTLVKRI